MSKFNSVSTTQSMNQIPMTQYTNSSQNTPTVPTTRTDHSMPQSVTTCVDQDVNSQNTQPPSPSLLQPAKLFLQGSNNNASTTRDRSESVDRRSSQQSRSSKQTVDRGRSRSVRPNSRAQSVRRVPLNQQPSNATSNAVG